MKLLTLNSHSLLEEDYLKKTQIFVEEILQENIDVFALQEVNQSHDDKILAKNPHNYYGTSILKQNNHALYIADLLAKQGKNYHWIWEDCHLGYDIYDEGIAIFSKYPIIDTKVIPLSKTQDHTNYKTRKALAICCEINQQKNMVYFYAYGLVE